MTKSKTLKAFDELIDKMNDILTDTNDLMVDSNSPIIVSTLGEMVENLSQNLASIKCLRNDIDKYNPEVAIMSGMFNMGCPKDFCFDDEEND
jgi:adenylate cyclase